MNNSLQMAYTPLLPVITLVLSGLGALGLFLWTAQVKPEAEKERRTPLGAMLTVLLLVQLLFQQSLLNVGLLIGWNLVGILVYFTYRCGKE